MANPDVLIVGGGVIGTACAWSLAARGVSVALLDAGRRDGAATWAAAGMLAPFAEAQPEDPILALSVRARDLYRDLAPQLLDETGVDIGLRVDGIVQVAFDEDELAARKHAVAWQRQSGFAVDWLDHDELRQRIPGIGPEALGAACASEDGRLDPAALQQALLAGAERRGARVHREAAVLDLIIRGGQAVAVRTDRETLDAGAVVVAAGAWSGGLHGLPRSLPVEPVRGQIAAVPWQDAMPTTIVYAGRGYILERGGEALVGSTMERAGFDASVTEHGLAALRATMTRIYPALEGAAIVRSWAGLRPVSPDGRPLLGPDPDVAGLWYACGHGRNGILLAALSGELLARQYAGEPAEHDLSPLAPARFLS